MARDGLNCIIDIVIIIKKMELLFIGTGCLIINGPSFNFVVYDYRKKNVVLKIRTEFTWIIQDVPKKYDNFNNIWFVEFICNTFLKNWEKTNSNHPDIIQNAIIKMKWMELISKKRKS